MNSKTTVGELMTLGAHTIGQEQTMATAHELMRNHRIRHLPVLHGGKLVGIVTERDLHLVETLKEVNAAEVTVEEAMSQEVYTVTPEVPLFEVASTLHRKRYGSAVVLDGKKGKVIGVFTTTDALRALSTALAPKTSSKAASKTKSKPTKKTAAKVVARAK